MITLGERGDTEVCRNDKCSMIKLIDKTGQD